MIDLLTFGEIQQGLNREFLPLEPMLTGLRLIDGGVSERALAECESQFGVVLPDAFRKTIKAFDFGRLTIGPIVFCNTGDYLSELVQLNIETSWWDVAEVRPKNLLMIANSDPYAVILDVDSGTVMAMDREVGWKHASHVAKSFDLYLRGVGSAMLRRREVADPETLARDLSVQVGGSNPTYWIQLTR